MKIFNLFFFFISSVAANVIENKDVCLSNLSTPNNCITFTVSEGTGCDWMCNYCANQLGTNNYYFTDNVCSYQQGIGCVGNPITGKSYKCCSL